MKDTHIEEKLKSACQDANNAEEYKQKVLTTLQILGLDFQNTNVLTDIFYGVATVTIVPPTGKGLPIQYNHRLAPSRP